MHRGLRCAVALAAAIARALDAQAAPVIASVISTAPELPADTRGVWTVQGETSSVTDRFYTLNRTGRRKITDRFYTNGTRFGWTSPEGLVPTWAHAVGDRLLGAGGRRRVAIDLMQQLFTPYDTRSPASPPGDRPYAATLMVDAALLRDTQDGRSSLGIGVGMLGPTALGEQVQNGFHGVIDQGPISGWDSQLPNEPVVQLRALRSWRRFVAYDRAVEFDVIPTVAVALGTLRTYGQGGAVLRMGRGLRGDFGHGKLRVGSPGFETFRPTTRFAWSVVAGGDVRGVARDATLDGPLFRSSARVDRHPVVAEWQTGFSVMAWGVRITHVHVWQTPEFRGQLGGMHQFASLNIAIRR